MLYKEGGAVVAMDQPRPWVTDQQNEAIWRKWKQAFSRAGFDSPGGAGVA